MITARNWIANTDLAIMGFDQIHPKALINEGPNNWTENVLGYSYAKFN